MNILRRLFGRSDSDVAVNDTRSSTQGVTVYDFRSPEVKSEEARMMADATAGRSLGPEVDALVDELLQIDRFIPGGVRNARAREIGAVLYSKGNGHVRLMLEAYFRVQQHHACGAIAARELSACWSGLGATTAISPGENAWVD